MFTSGPDGACRIVRFPLGIEPEGGFLAGSRPIEMQDVVVNDFENGNQKWVEDGGSANDFEITFE